MASQTAMDTMDACKNSWPTDHMLFEAAKLKAPEQAKKLDDLLEMTEQVMREKDILDHRVGQILGLEVMVAYDWPTDRTLFLTAIVKANSMENYALNSELQERWILVKEDMKCKTQLDELITQILAPLPVAVPVAAPVQDPQSQTVQNVLMQSGAFEHDYEKHGFFTESDVEEMRKEREGFETKAQWTEEDYKLHCLPKNAGPYDHLTEEDWDEYERQVEAEKRDIWSTTGGRSHSDCYGNHGDEMRDGFILHKGPVVSPITVPQAQEQPQVQPQPICSPTLQCSWPEFCRCGWQFNPVHEVAQFRGGTAEWDAKTERWTWTSTSTLYSSTWSQHFPLNEQAQEQINDYIEEVDQWTKDMVRLVAESKALREAPLSAFADLAGQEDDDTIPEVDIEAA
jgi:hypothetical protein